MRVKHCGTNTGYVEHYRDGEKPCDACVAAHKAYQKQYNAARHVAVQSVLAAHREEYQTALVEALTTEASA